MSSAKPMLLLVQFRRCSMQSIVSMYLLLIEHLVIESKEAKELFESMTSEQKTNVNALQKKIIALAIEKE